MSQVVILSPSLVILSGSEESLFSVLRVNSAKDLGFGFLTEERFFGFASE
jgi:hypothetical protein